MIAPGKADPGAKILFIQNCNAMWSFSFFIAILYETKEGILLSSDQITSRENSVIKNAVKLLRCSKSRKRQQAFFIEGLRLCLDAAFSNIEIIHLFYTQKVKEKWADSLDRLIKSACEVHEISETLSGFLSDTTHPQGIFCICKIPNRSLDFHSIPEKAKLIALETIQDPSNLGTMLRTAEALGMNGVILSDDCCDVYSPKVLRGSMGAVFRIPFTIEKNLPNTIQTLTENGFSSYASVPDQGGRPITEFQFSERTLVAIGNEGNGLTNPVINACSAKITIPMLGRSESLNAAVAATIIMWEMTFKSLGGNLL